MNHQSFVLEYLRTRDRLAPDDRRRFELDYATRSRNPMIIFGFNLFLGWLGIDRFVVGDWGKGLLKLLTLGGLFIWVLVDLFLIGGRTRDKNALLIRELAEGVRTVEPAR